MSRSGYIEDCDDYLEMGRWRGRVASAMRGKRGQALLRDLRDALDAMPVKRLGANSFQAGGDFCTLGVLGHARGLEMADLEPKPQYEWREDECDADLIGERFNVASSMAQEIMYMNDEAFYSNEDPEHRWVRMRAWVDTKIIATA